MPLLANTTLLL